jgi:hypothetical protein
MLPLSPSTITADSVFAGLCRRVFLQRSALGLGATALGSLCGEASVVATAPAVGRPPRAKRVIVLTQAGGPSHLETFDPKPQLAKLDGAAMPESFTAGQQIAQLQGQRLQCFGPRFKFAKFGQAGTDVCELFPQIGSVVDELCVVRSMWTEQINHDPAQMFMNTGARVAGYPSMGSWVTYGLGSESANLPGFIVLISSGKGGQMQPIAARQWSAGFLPGRHQGVKLNSQGAPVLYIQSPAGISSAAQADTIATAGALNELAYQRLADAAIETRISQCEMAFRMQSSVPDLVDLSDEPQHMLDFYSCTPGDGSFASNCLMARRLAERGVRFIQLYHRDWDHHADIASNIAMKAGEVDQATAALIRDLKQRGMLDETLVIWGGEFGRTPMSQGGNGRDHHIKGFTYLLAGGGVKAGHVHGATDELGYAAVESPVSMHDLHATMLHLLGINAERFSVKFQGLDARLIGVEGATVAQGLLA